MKIAFFDSGLGGVTVLKESLRLLADEDYIYFADTLNVPYGEKTREQVKAHILDAVEFIASKDIKALVVACNTATSIAIKPLREIYKFPIIGMEPAVKPAVACCSQLGKRVLVFATPLTLKESKFHELLRELDAGSMVDSLALPELVDYAESGQFDPDVIMPYLKNKLSSFDLNKYGTAVLGCTHFPLFEISFKEVLPAHIDIIHGAEGTVNHLKKILQEKGLNGGGSGHIDFYSTGNTEKDRLRFTRVLSML